MFLLPSKLSGHREFLVIPIVTYSTGYYTIEYNICCMLQGVIVARPHSSAHTAACVCVRSAIWSRCVLT